MTNSSTSITSQIRPGVNCTLREGPTPDQLICEIIQPVSGVHAMNVANFALDYLIAIVTLVTLVFPVFGFFAGRALIASRVAAEMTKRTDEITDDAENRLREVVRTLKVGDSKAYGSALKLVNKLRRMRDGVDQPFGLGIDELELKTYNLEDFVLACIHDDVMEAEGLRVPVTDFLRDEFSSLRSDFHIFLEENSKRVDISSLVLGISTALIASFPEE